MKLLMLTGALFGFVLGMALGHMGRADWPSILWRACAAAAALGLLTRWWSRVWLRGLQAALLERRAAEALARQQTSATRSKK